MLRLNRPLDFLKFANGESDAVDKNIFRKAECLISFRWRVSFFI